MRSALVIRHVPYEDLAAFRQPIEAAGYGIGYADAGSPSFDTMDFSAPDLLVVMGGPMGVYENDRHPWISGELEKLSKRIATGKPTLGVCLGSQMMAAAMGARVYPGPVKEIGFAPVALTAAGKASPLRAIGSTPVLHWHGDTFDLPENTDLLASTAAYRNQAFRQGPNILALQFHPEMGSEDVEDWLPGADAYLAEGGTSAAEIRNAAAQFGTDASRTGAAFVKEWLTQLTI